MTLIGKADEFLFSILSKDTHVACLGIFRDIPLKKKEKRCVMIVPEKEQIQRDSSHPRKRTVCYLL